MQIISASWLTDARYLGETYPTFVTKLNPSYGYLSKVHLGALA